jgi:MFS family permease
MGANAISEQARTAPTPFLSALTRTESGALIATFAGWCLDGMDVMAYSFVLPTLITLWHLSKGQAGLLGTSALIVSALGGWLAGLAADRYGRVRILQLTILWFAVFTFLSGFAHSFPELLAARALQGLGFGGEWAVGSVLIGETIRKEHRGKAVGLVQSGWAIGWGLAAIFYTLFFLTMPVAYAWRAMFWIGLLPALLVFYIGRRVHEPEVFDRQSAAKKSAGSFAEIFSRGVLKTTLLTSLVALGVQGGYYAITTWLPLYLSTTRGLSVFNTGKYLCVVILGSFAGYLTSAWLTDRLGRRGTLIIFAACSFLTVSLYMAFPISNQTMLLLGFPLGFFPSGSFGPVGSFFTELFPTRVRGSGQGFSYNLGRGVGALFPTLVGALTSRIGLGRAIATFAAAAYLLMVLGVLALPETRGHELQD